MKRKKVGEEIDREEEQNDDVNQSKKRSKTVQQEPVDEEKEGDDEEQQEEEEDEREERKPKEGDVEAKTQGGLELSPEMMALINFLKNAKPPPEISAEEKQANEIKRNTHLKWMQEGPVSSKLPKIQWDPYAPSSEQDEDYPDIRVNLPRDGDSFGSGNGEGGFCKVNKDTKDLFDKDYEGGIFMGWLDIVPIYPQWKHLQPGDPVIFTMRGKFRPVAFFDQEAAAFGIMEKSG